MTIYSGLPLYKTIAIEKSDPSQNKNDANSSTTMDQMMSAFAAPLNSDLKTLESQLVAMSLPQELVSIPLNGTASPVAAFTDLKFEITDTSIIILASANLLNPTVLALTGLKRLAFGLTVQSVNIGRVLLTGLELNPGLQTMTIRAEFIFNTTNPNDFVSSLSFALTKGLAGAGLLVGISGPIEVSPISAISNITKDFSFDFDASAFLSTMSTSSNATDAASAFLPALLNKGRFQAHLDSTSVTVNSNLFSSRPAPLPPKILFPYKTGFTLSSKNVKIITLNANPLSVLVDETSLGLNASLTVDFVNTEEAAVALANAVNPMLSANSRDSSVEISNILIAKDDASASKFAWVESLFGSNSPPFVISIPAGTIDLANMMMSGKGSSVSSLPIAIKEMKISQMNDGQGFIANGNLSVALPSSVPPVSVNLGYASLNLLANGVKFATASLPEGFIISNTSVAAIVPLKGQLALPSDNLSQTDPALQLLIDAFRSNSNASASFGLNGISFGPSSGTRIITLSMVQLEFSTKSLKPLISLASTSTDALVRRALRRRSKTTTAAYVTANSAVFQVQNSSKISASAEITLDNLSKYAVSIGSTSLAISMNGAQFADVSIRPLQINQGLNDLPVAIDVSLETGRASNDMVNGMEKAFGKVLSNLIGESGPAETSGSVMLGVNGLVLDTGNPATDITLFKNLNFRTSAANLIPVLGTSTLSATLPSRHKMTRDVTIQSVFDFSAILPNMTDPFDSLNKFEFRILSAEIEAAQGNVLRAKASVSYKNDFPVQFALPFVALSFELDGIADAFEVIASSIILAPGQQVINPELEIKFSQDPILQTSLASLFDKVTSGRNVSSKIILSGIRFGGSRNDENLLLSKIQLDMGAIISGASVPFNSTTLLAQMLKMELPATVETIYRDLTKPSEKPSTFQMGPIAVSAQASKSLNVQTSVSMMLPFPLSVNVGYLNIGLQVAGSKVADVRTGLVSQQGQDGVVTFAITALLQFQDEESVQREMARLVNNILEGNKTTSSFGITNLAFGTSESDFTGALSNLKISQDVDNLILPNRVILAKMMMPKTDFPATAESFFSTSNQTSSLGIGPISISTQPGKIVNIQTSVTFTLPLQFSVNIGYLKMGAVISGKKLADVETGLISRVGKDGATTFDINAKTLFYDDNGAQGALGDFMNNVMSGSKTLASVGIASIAFGESANDYISSLSQVGVVQNVDEVLAPNGVIKLSSLLLPRMNFPATAESLLQLSAPSSSESSSSSFQMSAVKMGLTEGKSVNFEAGVSIVLPFSVAIDIGYLNIGAFISGEKVADFQTSLRSQVGDNGATAFAIKANVKMYDEDVTQMSIAKLINSFLAGEKTGSSLGFSNVRFGASPSDHAVSFASVRVAQAVDDVIAPNGPFDLSALLLAPSSSTAGNSSSLGFQLQTADVSMSAGKRLTVGTNVSVTLPFITQLSIPAMTVNIGVDELPMIETQTTGFSMNSGLAGVTVGVVFKDSDAIATRLAGLVGDFKASRPLQGTAVVSGAGFGTSADQMIMSFAKVNVPLKLAPLASLFPTLTSGGGSSAKSAISFKDSEFSLGSISVSAQSGRTVVLDVGIGLKNFPVSVNIPYSFVTAGLDDANIFSSSQSLAVGNGATNTKMQVSASFPSNQQSQLKVAAFSKTLMSDGFGTTNESFAISGIQFGVSALDSVTMFSKIRILAPSSALLSKSMNAMFQSNGTQGASGKNYQVQSANLDLGQPHLITAGVSILVGGFDFNTQVDIGHLGMLAAIDDHKMADLNIPRLQMSSNGSMISLSASTLISLQDTAAVQTSFNNIFNKVIGSSSVAVSTGQASGFAFGVSDKDYIDTFQLIAVSMPLDSYIDAVKKRIASSSGSAGLPGGLKIQNTELSVASSSALLASFAADVGDMLPGQVSLNIPYIGASVFIGNQAFVVPVIQNLKIVNNIASGAAFFDFRKNPALVNQIANSLAVTLVPSIPEPSNFDAAIVATVSGLQFGASRETAFGLISKPAMTMDVLALVKKLSSGAMPAPFQPPVIQVSLQNSGVMTSVRMLAPLVPFPFTNKLGPIQVGISYDVSGDAKRRVDIITPVINEMNIASSPSNIEMNVQIATSADAWGEIVPLMLENKPFLDRFYLSGVKLGAFDVFSDLRVKAPAYDLPPSNLNLPFSFHKFIGDGGLNMQVTPQLKNPIASELSISIGTLSSSLDDVKGNILTAKTPGSMQVNPASAGGFLSNNEINVHIPIDLNPITLLVRIGELLHPSKNFKLSIDMTGSDGKHNDWLSTILSNLPGPLIQQLPEILSAAVGGQMGGGLGGKLLSGGASILGGIAKGIFGRD
ncbi:hypothetical protein HDU78_002177 [Chytriomyces hyalinus]|nr:hypothetical protein HDU78_002177 [Chytriomyces hyalinus]